MGAADSYLRDDADGSNSAISSTNDDTNFSGGGGRQRRGVTKRIPIEVKPRARLGLRSVKSFGRPKLSGGASGSLRSALSDELEPSNAEAERVRRDFEAYRLQREGESGRAQARVHAFETENRRLRAELRAMQTAVNKLRDERDSALAAEQQAVVRAAAFESNRDKIQRQFKIFRETKESELQNLLKARRKLEALLVKAGHPILDEDTGSRHEISLSGMNMGDWWTTMDSEPSLGSTTQLHTAVFRGPEFAHTLMELEGPYFNINKEDWNTVTATLAHMYPTMHESVQTHTIRVYVSASEDVKTEVDTLLQQFIVELRQMCLSDGRFLVCTHMPQENHMLSQTEEQRHLDARQRRIASSSMFIAFLGKHIDTCVLNDIKTSCLDQPTRRPTIICCRNKRQDPSIEVIDLTRRLEASTGVKVIEYGEPDEGADMMSAELERTLKMDLGVDVRRERDSMDAMCQFSDPNESLATVFSDVDHECEQLEAVLSTARATRQLGFEKYYKVLNAHVAAAGPVQPQLIAGAAGSGRSLLLAKWIEQLRQRPGGPLVLSHFVGSPTSCSANSTLMMRTLSAQLMQQLNSPASLPYDPIRLVDEFPKWLEKISSKLPSGIVLVLDSVDRLQNVEAADLQWLLDPLPVNSRVVVSVQDDMCPQTWRSWPTLHLEPLNRDCITELVHSELTRLDCRLTADQEAQLASSTAAATPLYLMVMVSDIARCADASHIDERISSLVLSEDTVQLYQAVIDCIQLEHSTSPACQHMLCQILKYIYASRNGVSETELFELIADLTWNYWAPLEIALTDRHILAYHAGLLTFAHEQLYLAIKEKYFSDDNDSELDSTRRQLMHCFQNSINLSDDVSYRVTDELPWLCRQLQDKEALRLTLLDMRIFLNIYSRGRCSELVGYWQYLGVEKAVMAQSYLSAAKKLESMVGHSSVFFTLPKIADIYEALGKFLSDLALLNEALMPLQRALELRETSLDPDHPAVAQGLHALAGLHARQAKYSVAEALYKQACEIYAGTYGADHCSVAREMHALCRLYHKQGKHQLAEPLHKRALSIRRKSRLPRMSSAQLRAVEPLKRRVLEFSDLTLGSNSADLARTLNEIAVLCYLQNNIDTAETFFKRALEMRESILGNDHPDVAQSLNNLAGLYNDKRQYELAEPLYRKALEIRRKHFPPDHANIGNVIRHLAMMYKKMGEIEKAKPLYREMVESRERAFGTNHPAVATMIVNLAVLYSQDGNHADALPLYDRALRIYEDSFGPSHPRVAETLRNLAVLKYDQGEYETAAKLYKRATEIKESPSETNTSKSPHGSSADIYPTLYKPLSVRSSASDAGEGMACEGKTVRSEDTGSTLRNHPPGQTCC